MNKIIYGDKDILPEKIEPKDVRVAVTGKYLDALRAENQRLKAVVEAAREASETLNAIKFELYASVYTLTDDEFEQVFFSRDIIDEALAALDRGSGAEGKGGE